MNEDIVAMMNSSASPYEKRTRLMEFFKKDKKGFYRLYSQHIKEWTPVVYDPGIAIAIEQNRGNFLKEEGCCVLSINKDYDTGLIQKKLREAAKGKDVRLIVVTDGEAILGIGDWGYNGGEIALGKLMVYIVASSLDPSKVLPVVLDCGTNNETLLNDPHYAGLHLRRNEKDYWNFVHNFVIAATLMFPDLYLHFEDFGRSHARKLLDWSRHFLPCFNDDIEGTGIVALGALLRGMKIKKEKLKDQTYLCYGAGSAGCGIAEQVYDEMREEGLSEEEAKKRIYLFDKEGLISEEMKDLTDDQQKYARDINENPELKGASLLDVIKKVRPTIIVGTSTNHGAFNEDIIKAMCSYCSRPLILPLSNPTEKIEADPHDILKWSKGKALIATGIPYGEIEVEGKKYLIAQGNNFLTYPGLGLGVLASKAGKLTKGMIRAASYTLASYPLKEETLLPRVENLRDLTEKVALSVMKEALKEGLTDLKETDFPEAINELRMKD